MTGSAAAYRAAIIGCGRVAWMLEDDPLEIKPCTHMGAYEELAARTRRVEVVSAADTDAGRLRAFGERYGVEAVYEDYREMLDTVRPDIVSVCAWAPERRKMVLDSIASGVKGIWCEKAFATSLAEAREMTEACRSSGTTLIVSHLRRWSGEYARAKEIIETGGIGELKSIVAHFSGSMVHTGTHAFDILRWFAGDAEWVEGEVEEAVSGAGEVWEIDTDRGGRATIGFENGVYATVHGDSRDYFFFEFDVIGTRGRIRIGNNRLLELYRRGESRNYEGVKELYREPFEGFERKNIWTGALENLMDCMEGKGENGNSPIDGTAALELAIGVHASSRKGGARVALPLGDEDFKVRSR